VIQEELVRNIANETKLLRGTVKAVLEGFGRQIAALKPGEEIRTTAVGTFSVSHHNGHIGRNPKTGAAVEVGPKNVVRFKAAKHIRDAVYG
jgi:nucleoid DNA-binding protein